MNLAVDNMPGNSGQVEAEIFCKSGNMRLWGQGDDGKDVQAELATLHISITSSTTTVAASSPRRA